MLTVTNRLLLQTTKPREFINITPQVVALVASSAVLNGCVVVYSRHTTAAIKVTENEPLLIQDMEELLEKVAPRDSEYRHNDFKTRTVNMTENERANGHAHCQHLLMNASETVPIVDGELQLGRWQSVFFVELDGPNQREVVLQALGE